MELSKARRKPIPAERYTATYYAEVVEGASEFAEGKQVGRFRDAIVEAQIRAGMRVLDIGCGRGELAIQCAELGCTAWGVDFSRSATAIAQRELNQRDDANLKSRVVFLTADAKSLAFTKAFFDRAFLIDVAEHLHRWELELALDELRRVVKPGGLVVIRSDPNAWLIKPIYLVAENLFGWTRHPYHVNLPSYPAMRQYIKSLGGKGRIRFEKAPGFFAKGLGAAAVPNWTRRAASIADRIMDSSLASFLAVRTPLRLLLASHLWGIAELPGEEAN